MFESLTQEEVDEFNELNLKKQSEKLSPEDQDRWIEIIAKFRMRQIYSNLVYALHPGDSIMHEALLK